MLTAAVNYMGTGQEKEFAAMFVKLFPDFKVVRVIPDGDLPEDPLQICQPESNEEILKKIKINTGVSENFIELRGPKDKLQKVVRSMFFLGKEKRKILLDGADGIADFPWAIQIAVVQLPVPSLDQKAEWMWKADLIVLFDFEAEVNKDFIAKVKTIRPDLPIFSEKGGGGLSGNLKDSLEAIFATYLEKREKIKRALEEEYPDRCISCDQARRLVGKLGVSGPLMGNVCDEWGYRITHCAFCCF